MSDVLCEERHGRVLLRQLRVLRQEHATNCGFHALYNAQQLLAAPSREAFARAAQCSALFWRFFWRAWRRLTAEHGRFDRLLRSTGELSGSDMPRAAALLGVEAAGARVLSSTSWQSVAVAMCRASSVRELVAAASAARRCPGRALVCVVGVTGHWVAMAVTCDADQHTARVDIMDSEARPLLDQQRGWRHAVETVVATQTAAQKLKPYQSDIFFAQLSDTVRTALMLGELALGVHDAMDEAVGAHVVPLVDSFAQARVCDAASCAAWLESLGPSAVVDALHVAPHASSALAARFAAFAREAVRAASTADAAATHSSVAQLRSQLAEYLCTTAEQQQPHQEEEERARSD